MIVAERKRIGLMFVLAVMVSTIVVTPAQAQLRIVTYNVARVVGDLGAMTDVFAHLATDDTPGFAVAPHVYVFQEVESSDLPLLANALSTATPGVIYQQATFTNFGEGAGAEAMYYRSDTFQELPGHIDLPTGGTRFTDRWQLQLVGYDSPDASLYIYGSHLKASTGGSNEQERFNGVVTIRNNADALPADAHILYAGDMNFYGNFEAGYLEFMEPGPGQAVDPLGNFSWAGAGNAIRHTQSPRMVSQGETLIGGGMDDRFDFQLLSTELDDTLGLTILPGTYRSFGNDGQHFDTAINNGVNTYFSNDIPRSNDLADALHDASDHIPVVAEYQVPARFDASLVGLPTGDFGRVIQGALFAVQASVGNGAAAQIAAGADTLLYTYGTSGVLTGSGGGTVVPFGAPITHFVLVNTSAVGVQSGSVDLVGVSQGTGTEQLDVSGVIVRTAAPSLAPSAVVTNSNVPWTVEQGTGIQQTSIPVFNVGYDALQALLDVDAIDGLSAPFGFAGGLVNGVGPSPAVLSITFDTDQATPGDHSATAMITTSDENLPGEQTTVLSVTIDVTVDGIAATPGDLDMDGDVDFADLLILLGQWGACPTTCTADLDGDGQVGFSDILALLANWG